MDRSSEIDMAETGRNEHLIGMDVEHKKFGWGVIKEVRQRDDIEYFYVLFAKKIGLQEFRLDILVETPGKYFLDCLDEIVRRQNGGATTSSRPEAFLAGLPYNNDCLPSFKEEELRIQLMALGIEVVDVSSFEVNRSKVVSHLRTDSNSIEESVTRQRIPSLAHFTHARNLFSIIEKGILPRAVLAEARISAVVPPDDLRSIDSHAVTLSISFPEYESFRAVRSSIPKGLWAVLEIEKSVLWESDCYFAASSDEPPRRSRAKASADSFDQLFQDYIARYTRWGLRVPRSILDIPGYYPTNPHSEVRVVNGIEPRYIRAVWFETSMIESRFLETAKERGISNLPKTVVNSSAFEERRDGFFWNEFRSVLTADTLA